MTFYCCIEMAQTLTEATENASEIQSGISTEPSKVSSDELIVFDNETTDEPEEFGRTAYNREEIQTVVNFPSPNEKSYSRLCGYLNKLNTKGIIKAFRRRWFVFSEEFCKLYYYRSPDDILPLGEIDISRATFTFDATNHEKPGLFTISTPDKEFSLEAKDRHTCLFWLQELQRWRRIFSIKQTQQIDARNSTQKQTLAALESGLVAQSNNEEDVDEFEPVLMTPIDCPEDLSGGSSGNQNTASVPLATIAQQKFQNFKNQMKNSVSVTRSGRNESTNPTLTTYIEEENSWEVLCPENANEEITPSVRTDSQGNDDIAYASRTKPKSPKMSSIRRKLQGSFRIRKPSTDNEKSTSNLRKSLEISQNCSSCQELQGTVMSLRDDLCAVEDELEASREVVKVLHRQLDDTFLEKETLMRLFKSSVSEDSQGPIEILAQKDQEIAQLTHKLTSQQQECDALRNKNEHLLNEIEELNERTALFQELLMEKDKIVVSLTNEVFDLETEKRQKFIDAAPNLNNSPDDNPGIIRSKIIVETNETEDLKDAVQAFELQNKFLNKEILELNNLRKDGEEREHKLIVKCSEWEAKCCQIQSKLLYLLKELDKPHSDSQTQEVVSRLLEEATTDSSLPSALYISTWASNKDYDDLGFSWKWGKEEELLTKKADNLKQRSEDIINKMKNPETVSWRVKWDNFMVNVDSKDLQRSLELKMLIRSGIPLEYKGRIWKRCNDMRVGQLRSQCCPDYYENLLCASANLNKLDPSAKQIELDLLRTLPNNRHYETLDSDGIPRLRRVLLAYSRHNPAIGYCQGINRLAAILLLFMDEEDAFWCLVAILEYIMPPEYYTKTLMASQVDQRVLKELVSEKLPRLHSHLEQHKVDLSLFTFNWFLTIFVDNIPVEVYLRIWDVFLYEGSKVLFRFSLAFLKLCENDLLQLGDYMTLNKYLRTMTERKIDVKRLVQVAFNELNPFPMRLINHKRLQHTQVVKAQLDEFEAIRNSTPSLRRKDEWQSDED